MNKLSLKERAEPIYNKLFKIVNSFTGSNEKRDFIPPSNYIGILDNFIPPRMCAGKRLYILIIDKLHKNYFTWDSLVKVSGKTFSFTPKKEFFVNGTILDSGKVNDLDFYIIEVTNGSPARF